MEMRNKDGEMYKKSTMQSYRQGLQHHLSKTRDIDILKSDNFKKSKKAYQCMTKELKRLGMAAVEHCPAIADADMEKMYMFSIKIWKVFVDIMIHFGRRVRENLATLTRQDFAVQPEPEGSDRCPVRSFVKYIRRLNPNCNKLFQQPKLTAKDGIHYGNIPLGHNKLGIYMNEISKAANLSREYTNHSCRATTVLILDEAQIPSRHIMSVTGHKPEAYLKTCSGKTVTVETEAISTTSFGSFNLQPLSDSQTQNLINDIIPELAADDHDDSMDDLLKSLEVPRCIPKQSNSVDAASINQKAMPVPVFNNCSNITVNYNFIQKN
ncbi:unnamed protein product [Mytilus edulis]|uniref:Uncharacterized protein n=1 Tax=Mytilus edulis TaxID=6550 RepID=A0A8S3RPG2_MYTED|nr:unnamed protein product [Mytilus edulis]